MTCTITYQECRNVCVCLFHCLRSPLWASQLALPDGSWALPAGSRALPASSETQHKPGPFRLAPYHSQLTLKPSHLALRTSQLVYGPCHPPGLANMPMTSNTISTTTCIATSITTTLPSLPLQSFYHGLATIRTKQGYHQAQTLTYEQVINK